MVNSYCTVRTHRAPEFYLPGLRAQDQLPKLDVYAEGLVFLELLSKASHNELESLIRGLRCEWDKTCAFIANDRDCPKVRARKVDSYSSLRNAHQAREYKKALDLRTKILDDFLQNSTDFQLNMDSDDSPQYAFEIAKMLDPLPERRPSQEEVVEFLSGMQ